VATANVTTAYTLADFAKNLNPDGSIADVAELLSQRNEILEDMLWIEGNLPTGHRDSVRTSLPTPTWRRINQGVDPSKTTESQVTDTCGMSEAIAVVDKDLAILNGNSAKWRMSQNKGFLEGMAQDMAAQLLYANSALNPEKPMGIMPRYASLSTSTSQTANNVVTAGGSTASVETSILLVGWGDDTVRGIFPKGSVAGLQDNDEGEDWAFDANSKRYKAYITHYQWKAGLSVKDWRYIVRIPNIDTSTNAGGLRSSTPPDLVDLVDQAIARIPNLSACRPALYMNRTVKRYFNKQRNRGVPVSSTVNLTTIRDTSTDDQRGVIKRFENYDGIPLRIVDQILNTESVVS
jgi:hypothetical protein